MQNGQSMQVQALISLPWQQRCWGALTAAVKGSVAAGESPTALVATTDTVYCWPGVRPGNWCCRSASVQPAGDGQVMVTGLPTGVPSCFLRVTV